MRARRFIASVAVVAAAACSSSPPENAAAPDAGISLGDPVPGYVDGGEAPPEKERVDGGFATGSGEVVREDRFVTEVVSFVPGACAGFGATKLLDVVSGPPVGAGALMGGLDVVSLGVGGSIVLGFGDNAIVDGPGVDFIVFENAFWASGDPDHPAIDLARVSVSEDGVTWTAFPCTPGGPPPYGTCAGWRPVYATPGGPSPFDVANAGGEPYDLAEVGLARARFVKIEDLAQLACPAPPQPNNLGFDLDALAIVNAQIP